MHPDRTPLTRGFLFTSLAKSYSLITSLLITKYFANIELSNISDCYARIMIQFFRFVGLTFPLLAVQSVALMSVQVLAVTLTPTVTTRNSPEILLANKPRILQIIPQLDGKAYLMGNGGTFIGLVSSDPTVNDSICNPFGPFGSKEGILSIRNRSGNLGNFYSQISAYNSYANKPPILIYEGKRMVYLTKNEDLDDTLDPDILLDTLCNRNYQ